MLAILRSLGWLVCAVYCTIPGYWLLVHGRATYWRAQARSPYRVLLPLWALILLLVVGVTAPWRGVTLYRSAWMWLPAGALFAAGIWLYRRGGANFSLQQLRGQPELRRHGAEQRLVTTGIRARVRHPVYLAHLCEMLAWSVGTGLAVCFVLTGIAIVSGAVMIRAEDAELEQRFGEEYRAYRAAVPALLPRVR